MSQAAEKEAETSGSGADVSEDLILPMMDADGVPLPDIFQAGGCRQPHHVLSLRDSLKMRQGDVLMVAYPKAGTHWTWEMVSMLTSGVAEHHAQSKCFSMVEATPLPDLESQPSPRVLNTHLPFRLLPEPDIREKKVKVIHVYRNVRDVFISAYFHYRQIPGAENVTLDDLAKAFLSGKVPFGSYFKFMANVDEYRKRNPDVPFLSISFEDLKEDHHKMIGQLAQFLGVETSAQLVRDIAQATSFSRLREADLDKQKIPLVSPDKVFRKGEVGDWKNHMSEDQVKRFDDAMKELESCDYHFRYEL